MSVTTSGDSWVMSASCSGVGNSLLPEAVEQRRILELCATCPVRLNCLAEALDDRIPWGVWGGNCWLRGSKCSYIATHNHEWHRRDNGAKHHQYGASSSASSSGSTNS